MLRAEKDSTGGFYIFEDYAADVTGSLGLYALMAVFALALLYPLIHAPQAFSRALLCFLTALFIQVFLARMGCTEFLEPFATPFYVQTLIYTTMEMYDSNDSPSSGILLTIILPVVLGVILFLIFNLFTQGMAEEICIFAALVMSPMIFFSTYRDNKNENLMRILILVVWLAAFIKCLIMIIAGARRRIKTKHKFNFASLLMNLLLFAIGTVPVLFLGLLHIKNGIVLLIGATLLYAAAALAGGWLVGRTGADLEGSCEMLVAPLFGVLLLYLFSQTEPFWCSVMPSFFRTVGNVMTGVCQQIGQVFADLFRMIVNLVLLIFGKKIPSFHLPQWLSYLLFFAIQTALSVFLPFLTCKERSKG